ncbi:MAG TPA: geranylgeranylglycerol-phosphate geranylgeranyltransferase [Saprospiraceae bacterium]|nr:geranylgeranylglycerol-phosphate geranylgeranyltransferase [Saprospiraceae bacterium]
MVALPVAWSFIELVCKHVSCRIRFMIKPFIQISRWPNLLIVAGLQIIVYYRLLDFEHSVLSTIDAFLLVILTLLISAAGYYINDYYDSDIDRVNKPENWIVGNTLSTSLVLKVYKGIILVGAAIAIWIALRLNMLLYLPVYLLAVVGLQIYSSRLKCSPFIGNLWVAIFCGSVILIMAAPDLIQQHAVIIEPQFWFYIGFAFVITFYREVVKDVEDMEGDQQYHCRTFVVKYGKNAGRILAVIAALVLLIMLYLWENREINTTVKLGLYLLQGMVLASAVMFWWAKNKVEIHRASTLIKFVMVGGTLLLLF